MSEPQAFWSRQARSDLEIFVTLRLAGAAECHLLHYLQMATEKLSKAYLWQSGNPPPRTHIGFPRFIRAVLSRKNDLQRNSHLLGFKNSLSLQGWALAVMPLAYMLQKVAPAEAGDGPNAEYPWPHHAPTACPADHKFALWARLVNTGQGRKMLDCVTRAVTKFDQLA